MKLTPRQEKFAQLYVQLSNASEAYRQSYSASNMKTEVVHVRACELLKSSKVKVRVQEIQAAAVKRNELTIDDIVAELEEARVTALGLTIPGVSAMVAATMGKAKVLGLVKEKIEHSGVMGVTVNSDQAKRIAEEVLRGISG